LFSRCDASESCALITRKKGKRSAERRIVLPIAAPNAAARCLPTTRPPFGAHTRGTRHRLLPRWLSSRTGFPAAFANGGFARFALRTLPRLSMLHADRSLCRSTGVPKPPGSGWQNPRAGTASRHRCYDMPFRNGALSQSETAAVIDIVSGKSKALKIMPLNQCVLSGAVFRRCPALQ
jgi:hypothetical protein